MKKILFTLMIMVMLACPAMGARYRQFQVVIVDEFGDAVTNIDTVEIYDAGTSTTSTIYSTRAGIAQTNPMTTTSGGFTQSLGLVQWFQAAGSFKITVTESGLSQSLTVDNLTSEDVRFAWFVNYIGAATTLTVLDDSTLNIGTSADFTHDWDNANSRYVISPASDDSGTLHFGKAAVHADIYWHAGDITTDYVLFDEGSLNVQFIDIDLLLDDEAKLLIGDSSDVTIEYDETNEDLDVLSTSALDEIAWGATGDGYDQIWHSVTSGDYMIFDYSADALILEDMTLALGDGELLLFGDTVGTGTMSLSVATAKLSLLQVVADTGTFDIGAAGTDVPTIWHGETSGAEVTFTGDTVIVDGIDMTFNDTDILGFGDSAAEGTIASDATGLNVTLGTSKALNFLRATAGTVNFGADNTGLDVVFFGEAASQLVWWDQSGDEWFFGADAEGVDVTFYGDTASSYMKWDENGGTNGMLLVEAADISLGDSDLLLLGDAIGTGTIKVYATGNDLIIDGVAAETGTVAIGVTDFGLDFKLWAATNAEGVLWDASDEALEFTGANLVLDAGSSLTTPVEVSAATNTLAITESFKLVVLSHATEFVTTLPAASTGAGVTYRFVVGAAPSGDSYTIVTNASENLLFGCAQESETDTTEDGAVVQAGDIITFKDGIAVIGDWVEVTGDGTNWYVTGQCAADGGIELAQT